MQLHTQEYISDFRFTLRSLTDARLSQNRPPQKKAPPCVNFATSGVSQPPASPPSLRVIERKRVAACEMRAGRLAVWDFGADVD